MISKPFPSFPGTTCVTVTGIAGTDTVTAGRGTLTVIGGLGTETVTGVPGTVTITGAGRGRTLYTVLGWVGTIGVSG
jgi:hypothetical protein